VAPAINTAPAGLVLTRASFRFRLAAQNRTLHSAAMRGLNVFYCAPAFVSQSELSHFFSSHCILGESIAIDPPVASLLPAGNHSIIFDKTPQAFVCSTPLKIPAAYILGELVESLGDRREPTPEVLDDVESRLAKVATGPLWNEYKKQWREIREREEAQALKQSWRFAALRTILMAEYNVAFNLI
jgi:hypothetical protein